MLVLCKINNKYLQLKKLSRNYRSAGSSNDDFIRNYYQAKAREHQKQRDMEDWKIQSGMYRDPMDDVFRQENEHRSEAYNEFMSQFGRKRDPRDDQYWNGHGRNMRGNPYWSGRIRYDEYNHSRGKVLRMVFYIILWSSMLSLLATPSRWYVLILRFYLYLRRLALQ